MKKQKLLIGIFCLGMLLTLTGCGKIPKLANGEDVIASMDGKEFTANDLYKALKKKGGTSILVNMIDEYIISKEVSDDKDAKDYAKSMLEQYKSNYKQQGQDFAAALTSAGYASEDAFKEELVMTYQKNAVTKKYVKEQVTEDELKDYYNNHISDELSVKHILIAPDTKTDATDDEKAKAEETALNKAKDLINQLNNGADFETLAKENSSDSATATNGGVINNVTKEGYVTEFWNAANALEDGKYTSEPVKTQYGYHIIYRVSKTDKKSFDEIKDTLYDKVVDEKMNADENIEYKIWKQIREKYNLAINDSDIDSEYKETLKTIEK